MASIKRPEGVEAPVCKCGCGNHVSWMPGKGWATWLKGHATRARPGTRLGVITSNKTKQKQSAAAIARYAGKRRRDINPTGPGVYATKEYKQAAAEVRRRPCARCGSEHKLHAHHLVPGDDSTLIPLCASCHSYIHRRDPSKPYKGPSPPVGELAPLCACKCGLRVNWKRHRGWATFRKGHSGRVRIV